VGLFFRPAPASPHCQCLAQTPRINTTRICTHIHPLPPHPPPQKQLPDGTEVNVGPDRFRAAELLFQPARLAAFPGLEGDPLVAGARLYAWPGERAAMTRGLGLGGDRVLVCLCVYGGGGLEDGGLQIESLECL
jgi:hypothetical protein